MRRMSGARRPKRTRDGPEEIFTGGEGPVKGGAIFPRTLLPTRSRGRIATPPPAGGVGVAELLSWSIFAATSTPLEVRGVRIC